MPINLCRKKFIEAIKLARIDKPIGIFLLLWPTLSGLWIASKGQPSVKNLLVFILGAILTRTAGCIINDYIDKKLDYHVTRTRLRPLVTGSISRKLALTLFSILIMLSFFLVLLTNYLTLMLSIAAVILMTLYPFIKRYSYYPQIFLGFTFSWGILMAFAAENESISPAVIIYYIANVLLTIAYDTYYAMVDRDDDLKVGIKSTAILFGRYDRVINLILQNVAIVFLILSGLMFNLGRIFYLSLFLTFFFSIYQYFSTREFIKASYFQAFSQNNWVLFFIFAGIVSTY